MQSLTNFAELNVRWCLSLPLKLNWTIVEVFLYVTNGIAAPLAAHFCPVQQVMDV